MDTRRHSSTFASCPRDCPSSLSARLDCLARRPPVVRQLALPTLFVVVVVLCRDRRYELRSKRPAARLVLSAVLFLPSAPISSTPNITNVGSSQCLPTTVPTAPSFDHGSLAATAAPRLRWSASKTESLGCESPCPLLRHGYLIHGPPSLVRTRCLPCRPDD
ncbi:uncharacterized protein BJ171DRAFT_295636 [Polychytrium aggregatum]|uniref:uncharacterized protein n=1 Tax=Polychytrium aggregatum TaxID=110093 RepID=UPI0022FE2F89|nr:uncharacterized protein BJ171DRAFT_295636 [Polychytrium aggregatum]KAI9207338.1 hypothetical protein BJ171DRAFT_295636 [Polychytrium aggregatum]